MAGWRARADAWPAGGREPNPRELPHQASRPPRYRSAGHATGPPGTLPVRRARYRSARHGTPNVPPQRTGIRQFHNFVRTPALVNVWFFGGTKKGDPETSALWAGQAVAHGYQDDLTAEPDAAGAAL